jgi:hypothetical protein
VFEDKVGELWAGYIGRIRFRDRVVGGTPADPKLMEGWLKAKAGIEDEEEVRRAVLRTAREIGIEDPEALTYDELEAAIAKVADLSTNVFKRDEVGLYIEARQLKAALRESVNILFAGQKWGKTNKGPKAYFVERVFVGPARLHLLRPSSFPTSGGLPVQNADGIDTHVGHVRGAGGERSIIVRAEYVERPSIEFRVLSAFDAITPDWWALVWLHAQENGLGAQRSMGWGTFDLEDWRPVPVTPEFIRQFREDREVTPYSTG